MPVLPTFQQRGSTHISAPPLLRLPANADSGGDASRYDEPPFAMQPSPVSDAAIPPFTTPPVSAPGTVAPPLPFNARPSLAVTPPMLDAVDSPLASPSFPASGVPPLASRAERDAELARLRRIEANYERDKALLAREKPALARRDTHDVGNADADEQTDSPEKLAARLYRDIAKAIKRDA
jgi:hypothetical protein